MEYGIVEERSVQELEIEVKKYIDIGWEPIGGVTTSFTYNIDRFYQAMIKRK